MSVCSTVAMIDDVYSVGISVSFLWALYTEVVQ